MTANKFKNLKESLRDLEQEPGSMQKKKDRGMGVKIRNATRFVLLFAFGLTFLLYVGNQYQFSNPLESVAQVVQQNNQPDQQLLSGMREMLVEMGYEEMNNEELIALRSEGVTATYISRVRDLGFEDLTLEEAVRMQQAGVSSTFITMMQELGYRELDVEDLVRLRRNGITANFTSQLHDHGYTDVSVDQLIRLSEIGVTTALIMSLQNESDEPVTLEEIIRYRISHQ